MLMLKLLLVLNKGVTELFFSRISNMLATKFVQSRRLGEYHRARMARDDRGRKQNDWVAVAKI